MNIKKIILTLFIFSMVFFVTKDADAYDAKAVTNQQLQDLKNELNDYYMDELARQGITDRQFYYTITWSGDQYIIYASTKPYYVLHPFVFADYQTKPYLWTAPGVGNSGRGNIELSNGVPTLKKTALSDSTSYISFWKDDYYVTYTNFNLYHADNLDGNNLKYLRPRVNYGDKFYLNTSKLEADYVYDDTIPTPSNLRFKFILPSGIYSLIKPREMELTWSPSATEYNVEIQLGYNVTVNKEKHSRTVMFKTIDDNILSTLGTYKCKNDEVEAFLRTQPNASDTTFANGKLSLTYVYVRYISKDLKYGNWVKINTVTYGSEIDKGNIVSEYEEVFNDGDDEVVVKDTEYNGVKYDSNGKLWDPTKLHTMEDYLMAIPNLISSMFTGITSLLGMVGQFSLVFKEMFSFLPSEAVVILVSGIGALVGVGVFKILK